MIGKSVYKEGESSYLLEYEQKKIRDCARTLHNLAEAFGAETKVVPEETEDRKNLILKNRIKETRTLMADHLKEVARIVTQATMEEIHMVRFSERKEKYIAKMLSSEGLVLDDLCMVKKKDGRKEVVARLYYSSMPIKEKPCSAEEVAEYLTVLMDMPLQPCLRGPFFVSGEPENFYFEEEARFMVLNGFAKAIKENETISGDNYSFFETGEKEFICILSDGMGSGRKAFEESEEVVEKIERFIDTGFEKEKAIQMINDTFLMESEGRNMSTLDLCSIDLYTGQAHFFKVGAAFSLIKKDGYVEKIPSVSLPLGIFHEIEIEQQERKLLEGDYIIMFSDGVLDYYPGQEGEEILMDLVKNLPCQNPAQIASYLMKHTISRGKGKIGDDMTILVMGMWENRNKH